MKRIANLLLLGTSVAGCTVASAPEEATEPSGQVRSALVTDNRIALNRIALNRISLNRIALNRIALNRIALNRIALNRIALNRISLNAVAAGDLLATGDGRELLSYVASCALPEGDVLVGNHGGKEYEFPGSIGLARSWLRRPLDREDQRWVSACLLARVNAHDVSVQVSLRGPHRALRASDEEMATFTLEEGAFWGNIFKDEPEDWNSCRGADQAAGESGDLVDRDCAEPDPNQRGMNQCGFAYAGDCGGERRDACSKYDADGMFYERCATPDSGGRRRYREVITTFVKP